MDERFRRALEAGNERVLRQLVAAVPDAREERDELLDVLARQAAAGSRLTLDLLTEVVEEAGLARKAVGRVLVNEVAIDDVAQETLISMARSIGSFQGESSFLTWLFAIARRRVQDHLRRQRPTEPLPVDDVDEVRRISSEIATRETVRTLVAELPDTYRSAVELREYDRLSYQEIASHLGININTAKSHVARGRAMLAGRLGSETV